MGFARPLLTDSSSQILRQDPQYGP